MSGTGLWRLVPVMLALPLAVAILPGQAEANTVPGTCPIGGYAAAACPVADDAVIARAVVSRLAGLYPREDAIQVRVADGVVYLTGYVTNRAQADSAGILASSVRGVRSVCNNLLVRQPAGSDMAIMRAVKEALNRTTYNVHLVRIMVQDGVVTLTGMVDDIETRVIVAGIPNGIPGVTKVIDLLTVRQRWQN